MSESMARDLQPREVGPNGEIAPRELRRLFGILSSRLSASMALPFEPQPSPAEVVIDPEDVERRKAAARAAIRRERKRLREERKASEASA